MRLAGTAYGTFVRGKQPVVEAVPHIALWRQLPGLLSDGITLVKAKVQGRAAAAMPAAGVESSERQGLKDSGEVVDYGGGDTYDTL